MDQCQSLEVAQAAAALNPRMNVFDARRLLMDYHSGLLARHDQSLGVSRSRPSGHGSTLISLVEAWQVKSILRLMGLMRHRPAENLPEEQGWWVYVLDWFLGRAESVDFPHLPVPTHQDVADAWVIFCNLLYSRYLEDPLKHGQEAQETPWLRPGKAQAA